MLVEQLSICQNIEQPQEKSQLQGLPSERCKRFVDYIKVALVLRVAGDACDVRFALLALRVVRRLWALR